MAAGADSSADVGGAASAASAGADVVSAELEPVCVVSAEVEPAFDEAPDWRPLIAVTRSPLRILAVPVKPRLLARP